MLDWLSANAAILGILFSSLGALLGAVYKLISSLLSRVEHLEKMNESIHSKADERASEHADREFRHIRVETRLRVEIERIKAQSEIEMEKIRTESANELEKIRGQHDICKEEYDKLERKHSEHQAESDRKLQDMETRCSEIFEELNRLKQEHVELKKFCSDLERENNKLRLVTGGGSR